MRTHRRQGSIGQSLVELAIVAPFIIVLLAGSSQVGLVVYDQLSTQTAAREGARAAGENPNASQAFNVGLGTGQTHVCAGSDWTLNPVCKAVRASTQAPAGLIDPTGFTATIQGALNPGSALMGCNPAAVDDGYVTVTVTYSAPVFVPFVNTIFATSGSSRTISETVTARVEPCTVNQGN